jgi:hypothetical protein
MTIDGTMENSRNMNTSGKEKNIYGHDHSRSFFSKWE